MFNFSLSSSILFIHQIPNKQRRPQRQSSRPNYPANSLHSSVELNLAFKFPLPDLNLFKICHSCQFSFGVPEAVPNRWFHSRHNWLAPCSEKCIATHNPFMSIISYLSSSAVHHGDLINRIVKGGSKVFILRCEKQSFQAIERTKRSHWMPCNGRKASEIQLPQPQNNALNPLLIQKETT